jgi:hypothetical protein
LSRRADDLHVDHPRVVRNHRSAQDIAMRVGQDETSTEGLRQSLVYHRDLCDEPMETRKTGLRR